MITKTLQRSEDLYVQFTPEELNQLGVAPGDKFSCEIEGNSIKLIKYAEIELDMSDWPREVLMHLITKSAEENISVNEVITQLLMEQIEKFKISSNEQQAT